MKLLYYRLRLLLAFTRESKLLVRVKRLSILDYSKIKPRDVHNLRLNLRSRAAKSFIDGVDRLTLGVSRVDWATKPHYETYLEDWLAGGDAYFSEVSLDEVLSFLSKGVVEWIKVNKLEYVKTTVDNTYNEIEEIVKLFEHLSEVSSRSK